MKKRAIASAIAAVSSSAALSLIAPYFNQFAGTTLSAPEG